MLSLAVCSATVETRHTTIVPRSGGQQQKSLQQQQKEEVGKKKNCTSSKLVFTAIFAIVEFLPKLLQRSLYVRTTYQPTASWFWVHHLPTYLLGGGLGVCCTCIVKGARKKVSFCCTLATVDRGGGLCFLREIAPQFS